MKAPRQGTRQSARAAASGASAPGVSNQNKHLPPRLPGGRNEGSRVNKNAYSQPTRPGPSVTKKTPVAPDWEVGARVKAQVKSLWGQGWYPGRIGRKNANGTYFVIFDPDGDDPDEHDEVDNIPVRKP